MAPLVAMAALTASIQAVGITGSAGTVMAALGIFSAVWSLLILVADYVNDIIVYIYGSVAKDCVTCYNATLAV